MTHPATETFVTLLKAFGELIENPDLELDENSSCVLGIDELLLSLQWLPERELLLVYAPIGAPDRGENALKFCTTLLEANCLGLGTSGFTLGLSHELDSVTLSGMVSLYALDAERLFQLIEAFVEEARDWMASLNKGDYATVTDASDFDPQLALGALRI
jgi:hypothetical protein